MKKTLILFSIALIFSLAAHSQSSESKVWICSGSKTYHKTSSCIEIRKCGNTSSVAMATAKRQGKTACGVCYPARKSASKTSQATKTSNSGATKKQATKVQKPAGSDTSSKSQATKTQRNDSNQATKSQATKTRK